MSAQPAPTPSRRERHPKALALAGLVIAAVLFAACGGEATTASVPSVNTDTAAVEITGDTLPAFDMPDAALGLTAPTISGTTIDGQPVTIGDDDTARIYMFVAHWCPHCQAEVPEIAAWLETDPLPNNVELVAISTAVSANRENYPPSEWIQNEAWPVTAIADSPESEIAESFGLEGFPYWVAVDADGAVVQRLSGRLGVDQVETLIWLATN